ncbi:hypothetical protein CPB84DRAFT_1799021 [Gymnopilus junonius]|uniref:Uncharacterized protein n=1 Tax=Gymnopilus junonius TaxID=109634 RepID=A0A9P5N7M7_GYMJU|nr:hypothetical protein CPB84DRAFT_1799021 [Gymnopilus junonius]
MPPKASKPKIPDIPWGDKDDELIWKLLTECEKPVNYKVLFGKKKTTENTSGDSKAAMFKQIAVVILPDLTAIIKCLHQECFLSVFAQLSIGLEG